MEQGVLKCTVVLIFISDAYCASDNCIREFLHAKKHSKFLVVCLTPSGGQTHTGDSGWTGPGPGNEHWWHHATKMSSCKDPDTGKLFSWSALGQFTPIDLRIEHDANEKEAKRVQEDAVLEIVKRIMSRFHRGEHIQHANEQYVHWSKVALLDSFTADNPEQIRREATSIFKKLDADKNGNISKQELLKGIPQLDDKTADLLIAEADADKDGSISFEEFLGMILSYHANRPRKPAPLSNTEEPFVSQREAENNPPRMTHKKLAQGTADTESTAKDDQFTRQPQQQHQQLQPFPPQTAGVPASGCCNVC